MRTYEHFFLNSFSVAERRVFKFMARFLAISLPHFTSHRNECMNELRLKLSSSSYDVGTLPMRALPSQSSLPHSLMHSR